MSAKNDLNFVFRFMESLPEQIERIIIAKLSPRDRNNLFEACDYLGNIYKPLFTSTQIVDLSIDPYDIDWTAIVSFVHQLRTSLQKYLSYQDRNTDTICAGIKSFVMPNDNSNEVQVEEFATFIIDDIDSIETWEPFFYIIAKSSSLASVYINVKDNYSMIYNDEVQSLWKDYKHTMTTVFDYFHKVSIDIWYAIDREDSISIRMIKGGFMYGSDMTMTSQDDHWLVYDPYEYPTDDLRIDCDIFKLNQSDKTIYMATHVLGHDEILRLLRIIFEYTGVHEWYSMDDDFHCRMIPSDPLVHLFPEVAIPPRWFVDKEQNRLFIGNL